MLGVRCNMLPDLLRKLGLAAVAAAGMTSGVHLFLGWLIIYPLGPEHPEVLPRTLFREDVLESAPWVIGLFSFFEIIALAISLRLLERASCRLVLTVAGAVPAVVVVLFTLRVPWIYFDTPPGAVTFFQVFVLLTVALLYAGLHFTKTRRT
jgi:hypothetical protein